MGLRRGKTPYELAFEEAIGKVEKSAQGLSLMHNRPLLDGSCLRIRKDFGVNIAEGGRYFELHGQSLTGFKGVMKPRAGITTFSRKSRWELQKKMAIIDESRAGLPDFLTTTYPANWSEDWRIWKRDLKVFNQALIRRWPDVWGVWRLEFQKRGAPHFHYLLWDGPKVQSIQVWDCNKQKEVTFALPPGISEHNQGIMDWMSETWYRICGSGDPKHLRAGTRLEPIQTWNGVVSYASKYLAKLPDGSFAPVEYTGRFWGVLQSARWKTIMHRQDVPEAVFYMLRRVLRKKREKVLKGRKYLEEGQGLIDVCLPSETGFKLLVWAYRAMREKGSKNVHAPF